MDKINEFYETLKELRNKTNNKEIIETIDLVLSEGRVNTSYLGDIKKSINEMAQIGRQFKGNHKVTVISGDHNAHYIKDGKILFKFRQPESCPKSIEDLKLLEDYKSSKCNDEELNILVDWFSDDYVNLKGKIFKDTTNFERLEDEFMSQQEALKEIIKDSSTQENI